MTVDYAITLTYIAAFCIRKHISVVADLSSRGVATGVYRYIYPPKSVYLTHFYVVTGCFFLSDPGQIRYRASVRLSSCFFCLLLTRHNLYPPPNEIPGYGPAIEAPSTSVQPLSSHLPGPVRKSHAVVVTDPAGTFNHLPNMAM